MKFTSRAIRKGNSLFLFIIIVGLLPLVGRIIFFPKNSVIMHPADPGVKLVMRTLTLSIVVPATFVDFQCFSQRLLRALYFEVLEPPDEVIFVVSSVPNNISSLSYLEPPETLKVGVRVVPFHDPQNAARNRNIGGFLANCDILSFFDVDDIPHPQRFVIIRNVFKMHSTVQGTMFALLPGLHDSEDSSDFVSTKVTDIGNPNCMLLPTPCIASEGYPDPTMFERLFHVWVPTDIATHWCCTEPHNWVVPVSPAPGWSSFRREVFLNYLYDEGLNVGEDGNIIARLIHERENFTYWDIPLGFYESHAGRKELCGDDPSALHK